MARKVHRGVSAGQRFTAAHPCPICGGSKDVQGEGRCYGFLSSDETTAFCTTTTSDLPFNDEAEAWPHKVGADMLAAEVSGWAPKRIVATYDYVDEEGRRLFQVVRYEPKDFRQRRMGDGGWVNNLDGVRRVLYRLPEVVEAIADGRDVWVVEGEKDADRLSELGLAATCNPMGAGKWDISYSNLLRGARVRIVQDRDAHERGQKHARDVARSLTGVAHSVRVYEALTGKDASDHIDAGHTVEEFTEVEVRRLPVSRSGAIDGATFILDHPSEVPAIWGRLDTQEVVWAEGELLLIVGPQGVGKSTVMQQIALRRAGILEAPFLSLPVVRDARPILYVAADRPSQIQRSFSRMTTEDHRRQLAERLVVWRGPLPFNLTSEPDRFVDFVCDFGVGSVFIDSLKDIALDLSKDETGSRVNAAFQATLASGVEVVAAHHQRKAQANNKKPTSLADVYGSVWVTSGAGSVLLVWGDAGDSVVEITHLKQPAVEFGPVFAVHDHDAGTTVIQPEFDVRVMLRSERGMTVKGYASLLFQTDEPGRNQIEKARRKLKALVASGEAREVEREKERGGKAESVFYGVGSET